MTFARAMEIADDARAAQDVGSGPLAHDLLAALSVLGYQVRQVIGSGEIGDTDQLPSLVLDRAEFR